MRNLIEKKIEQIHTLCSNEKDCNTSLMGGLGGITLFNFYYAKYKNDNEAYAKAYNEIVEIINVINSSTNYNNFSIGLAGIGWIIEHLSKNDFIDVNTHELLGELDEFVSESMLQEINGGHYDYLHGALGIAQYLISRRKTNNIYHYLKNLIDRLDSLSETDTNGIKWKSIIDHKTSEMGYNISLSHGSSSIVILLSKFYKEEINKEKTKKMVEGAVRYILGQKLKNKKFNSIYPSWSIESSKVQLDSRLAWCYGDLGISVALWHASQAFGRKDWEEEAINTLLHSAKRRDLKSTGVVDATLCHGTSGIALIFRRMYGIVGVEELKNASEYWFNETIKIATVNDGLAGYKSYRSEEFGGSTKEYGLLEGIAGIGLSLISAVSDIEPSWDECLLLS
jgi:class I lanthipeptide synthase